MKISASAFHAVGWMIFCFALAQHGAAQTISAGEDTLRSAVVVGHSVRKTPATALPVQRLDTTAFRRRGITDTGDALRRFSGVNLRDYGGAGGLKTVSVRGMGAAHTTVTYDGLALNDVQQGQIDLQRFSIDRLAAMQLQTGGSERLLCPVRNLGAATLELTAFQPDTTRRGLHGTAALRHAAFGTLNPSLLLSHRAGRRSALMASADFYYAENDYPFTVENGAASTRERRTNSRMQTWTAEIAHTTLTPRGGTWRTKAYYHNSHRRLPGQVILYTNKNNERLAEQTLFAQTDWRQRFGCVEVFSAAKWDWQETRYADINAQYPGGALQQNYWRQEIYASSGVAATWGDFRLAYAADGSRALLHSNQTSASRVERLSLLQSLSLRWSAHGWTLTARAVGNIFRDDARDASLASRHARRLMPEASAAWQVADFKTRRGGRYVLQLRAHYKELFRLPSFTEAYFYHLGEQNLRPEKTRQTAFGATLQARPSAWWSRLSLTADGYFNRISDRIMSIPYNLFIWQTINMGEVRTRGFDITTESAFRLAPRHELLLATNYSLHHAADRTDRTSEDFGKTPAYTPRHSGAASLAYENPWLNFVAHTTFCSERWSTNAHTPGTRLPAYAEAGFGIYRTFQTRHARFEARADLLNAFDARYEVVRRYPMPGRAYKISLQIHF